MAFFAIKMNAGAIRSTLLAMLVGAALAFSPPSSFLTIKTPERKG
jgi:hypothetical protein